MVPFQPLIEGLLPLSLLILPSLSPPSLNLLLSVVVEIPTLGIRGNHSLHTISKAQIPKVNKKRIPTKDDDKNHYLNKIPFKLIQHIREVIENSLLIPRKDGRIDHVSTNTLVFNIVYVNHPKIDLEMISTLSSAPIGELN